MKNKDQDHFFDRLNPLKDYKRNSEGKFEYFGIVYRMKTDIDSKKLFARLWGLMVAIIAASFAGAFIPFNGLMYGSFLPILYAAELLVILLLLRALFTFTSNGMVMNENQYRRSAEAFPGDLIFLWIITVIEFIASIVYVIGNGFGNSPVWFFVYLLLKVICFVAGIIFKKQLGYVDFDTEDRRKDNNKE